MHAKITIHQPKPQTHLPTHELAARKQRAALLTPPKRHTPRPPKRQPGRKTWHVGPYPNT